MPRVGRDFEIVANGTVRVFVADRFIVEVEGNGVTMDTLKQALDKVDLAKLSGVAKGS